MQEKNVRNFYRAVPFDLSHSTQMHVRTYIVNHKHKAMFFLWVTYSIYDDALSLSLNSG